MSWKSSRAVKIANRAVLERSCAKLMPYQGTDDPGNRILSYAKQHAILHRALFIRNLTTLQEDWSSPRYRRYITSEDLYHCPTLREFVADPDSQYRDPRSERSGHVMLKDEHIANLLGWKPEITDGVDAEKLQNRQAIAGRLEQVVWMELPDSVDLVLLTDEEATKRFGKPIPDGIIPVTNAAAYSMKSMSRSGHPVALKNGDKPPCRISPCGSNVPLILAVFDENGLLQDAMMNAEIAIFRKKRYMSVSPAIYSLPLMIFQSAKSKFFYSKAVMYATDQYPQTANTSQRSDPS